MCAAGPHTIFGAVLALLARIQQKLVTAVNFTDMLQMVAQARAGLYDADNFISEVQEVCAAAELKQLMKWSFEPALQSQLGAALYDTIEQGNSVEVSAVAVIESPLSLIQARLLLQLGASVSTAPTLHEPPLLLAAKLGNWEIVDLLLAANADVNSRGAHRGE